MQKNSLGRIIWSPQGTKLSPQECEWLTRGSSAGIILFSHNYASLSQLKSLIAHIKEISPLAVVSVDQEGGKVQRLQHQFTRLPSVAKIGNLFRGALVLR